MSFKKAFSTQPPTSATSFKRRHKKFQKVQFGSFGASLAKAGIAKQVEASVGVGVALEILQERFGEGVEKHAKPKYIKNRVLGIEIAHPAVGEQISEQQENIIKAVNEKLGRHEVVEMQFLLDKNEKEFYD